jgi:hypothetical protein
MHTSVNGLNRILRRIKLNPIGDFSDLTVEEDFVLRAFTYLVERRMIISEESIRRFINSKGGEIDIRRTIGFLMGKGILRA